MKVLVTGHCGYIGCVLVPMLERAGYDVIGLDSDLYRACNFGPVPPSVGWDVDIRDVTETHLEGIDAVIHLAGLSNDPLGDINPRLTHNINTRATQRLAKIAKSAGVQRFIFSSSCSNYGASESEDWLTEESSLNPVTPYARSKVECEEILDKLADDNFTPVYLRSATAYGPSPRIRFDLVANNLTAWAAATGKILLKSDGAAWRPLVHVEDISQAFLLALSADKKAVHREAFNVGRNSDCMQIRSLAKKIRRLMLGTEIRFAQRAPERDRRTYRVDCTKIERIGFSPRWSVSEGISQLQSAFAKSQIRTVDFEGHRYARVAHIHHLMSSGALDNKLRHTSGG